MHRGYVGVFHNCCFWVWSPAGSQAVDRGVCGQSPLWAWVGWRSPALGLCAGVRQPLIRLRTHPRFQVWAPAGILGVCVPQVLFGCAPRQPGRLSGHVPTLCFRCGPQTTDWGMSPLGHFWSGAQAAGLLIRVRANPQFLLWAPSPLIWVHASRASGERWGCFSAFTVQGLREEGCQRPRWLWRVL